MKTAATWRCCLRPGPPPVYNGLLPVDRSDADGIGISALSVYESGTPPSQKIQHLGAAGGAHQRKGRKVPSRIVAGSPGPAVDNTAANSQVAAGFLQTPNKNATLSIAAGLSLAKGNKGS